MVMAWGATEWGALGSVLTAAVAAIAAIVAFVQVREMRRTREDQSRPFVVVDIVPNEVAGLVLDLIIENIGSTLARDVKIEFDPALATTRTDYDLTSSALFVQGIPSLPPGRRLTIFFDQTVSRLNSGLPSRYNVTVRYKNARGAREAPLEYVVDFGYLIGLQKIRSLGTHDIAKAAQGMDKMLKSLVSGGRIRVNTEDQYEKRAWEDAIEAITGEPPHLGARIPHEIKIWLARNLVVRSAVRWWQERWQTRHD